MATPIIKSRERVRDLAEVFTGEREVRSMLSLVGYASENIGSTLLEPSCGNGNFLTEILKRKLETVNNKYKKQAEIEFYIEVAVSSIYGIDISEENVLEARERMFNEVKNFYSYKLNTKKPSEGFWDSIKWILEKNIILGDMLNKIEDVVLVEYTSPSPGKIKRQEFRLVDQMKNRKKAETLFGDTTTLKNYRICNYNTLCS